MLPEKESNVLKKENVFQRWHRLANRRQTHSNKDKEEDLPVESTDMHESNQVQEDS